MVFCWSVGVKSALPKDVCMIARIRSLTAFIADSTLGELYERERSGISCASKPIGPIGVDSWAGTVVGYGHRNWRHHWHRNFSGEQRHGADRWLGHAGVCGMDFWRADRTVRSILLRRTGGGVPKSRRAVRLLKPRARSSVGTSVRVDEFVSGAAGGDGHAGGGLYAVHGFLFPVVATPLFTQHVGRYEFSFTAAQ